MSNYFSPIYMHATCIDYASSFTLSNEIITTVKLEARNHGSSTDVRTPDIS